MNNCSSSFVERLRHEFHSNPVNFRVILPDGSHGVVKAFEEHNGVRTYRVQACTPKGRYLPMHGVNPWHLEDDLELFYWSASIRLQDAA